MKEGPTKMKSMKKLVTLLLSLVMLCALAMPAMAEEEDVAKTYSITIDKAVAGHTYTAYQVFDGAYYKGDGTNNTTDGTEYLSDVKWGKNVEGDNILKELHKNTLLKDSFEGKTSAEDVAYVLQGFKDKSQQMDEFARVVGNHLSTTDSGKVTIDQNGTNNKIIGLTAGYYFVKDTGKYYLEKVNDTGDQVAFYRIEDGGTATLVLLLAPEVTEYTIPATVPVSNTEGAATVPVTAIVPGAFTKAPVLKSLTIADPAAFTSLPDYAFKGATQLETINGKTHTEEILKQFTNENLQKGSMPFLGTKIIGESDAKPTLDGYTVTSADGTLQVTVKTAQGKEYTPKPQDNAYLYYTGEEAVTRITISNPGNYEQPDNGDVVRVYTSLSDKGVTSNYMAGNTYQIVAKAGEGAETGKKYQLKVEKIDDVTYCYEFQRPLNGDTYSIDLKQTAPSGEVGNRECIMRAVIANSTTAVYIPIPNILTLSAQAMPPHVLRTRPLP